MAGLWEDGGGGGSDTGKGDWGQIVRPLGATPGQLTLLKVCGPD